MGIGTFGTLQKVVPFSEGPLLEVPLYSDCACKHPEFPANISEFVQIAQPLYGKPITALGWLQTKLLGTISNCTACPYVDNLLWDQSFQ